MELGEEKRKVSSDDFFFRIFDKEIERMRRKNELKNERKRNGRERERDRRALRKSLSYFAASFRDMVVPDI